VPQLRVREATAENAETIHSLACELARRVGDLSPHGGILLGEAKPRTCKPTKILDLRGSLDRSRRSPNVQRWGCCRHRLRLGER
jgi:hypothetical protein